MKTILWCGSLLLLASTTAMSQVDSRHYLETMYGPFAYLVSIHPAVEAALKSHAGLATDESTVVNKLNNSRLEISISDIKDGPLAEVLDKPLGSVYDFASAPQEVLEVNVNRDDFQDVDQPKVSWPVADAKWVQADPSPPKDVMDFFMKRPVRMVLSDEEERLKTGLTYSRYAAYTVHIHYQGKSIQYKAFVFFAVDKDGDIKALPEDNFLISNAFRIGGGINYYPSALLRSSLVREYQPLQQFLKSHTVNDQKCEKERFCCANNACGIASADLDRELRGQK
jgi:hypothetical protein